jgi:hypothetical protein
MAEDQDDDIAQDEEPEQAPAPARRGGYLASVFGPGRGAGSSGPSEPTMNDAQRGAAIRQIDDTERKIGYFGAAGVAVLALAYFIPHLEHPGRPIIETVARTGKTCAAHYKAITVSGAHDCEHFTYYSRGEWISLMALLLAFAIGVAVATRIGRRSAVAFALLLTGFAVEFTSGSILGILFVGAGGWLIIRAWRVQRYGDPKGPARGAGPAAKSPAPKPRGDKPVSKRSRAKAPEPAVKAPTPNKRYTPKAPPRKKISPPAS